MPPSFLASLTTAPLLADGAMGTMLHARGIPFDICFDQLNIQQPTVVAEIHQAYLEAGARLIITNSFGANRYKLALHGLEAHLREINSAAVTLARQAIATTGKDAWVAGDVGPLGIRLAPFGRVKPEQAHEAFAEQIAVLVACGVDAILIETMSDLYEVAEAIKAAKSVGSVPVAACMTFTRDDRTLLGDTPAKVAARMLEVGADVIGVNCSGGPAQVLRLLNQMKKVAPTAKFLVKPNAGWPERVGGRIMYPATPEYFSEYARAFAEAGAHIIGGCCGTTPGHITAMHTALANAEQAPVDRVLAVTSPDTTEQSPTTNQPSPLAQKLARGHFVIGVEMDPPKGFSTFKLMAGASLLGEAGADVINVADSPMARMRMSAWAVSHLLQHDLKLETVLHFPTRGRNLLRVQGDLLAAHALGIRNVFVVMGDPTAIGDYPNANDNYDLVPSGLIKLIKQGFNEGVDHAGSDIGQPTSFFVGCALNLCAPDVDKEIKTLRKKLEAGADFALTQPIYETTLAREFLRRYAELHGPLQLPILAGVLPLYNQRHASFLHNEVPGITIPEKLRQRIAQAGEQAPAEGVKIAVELLQELRDVVQGAYLMPPFGRYELAAEIIELARASIGPMPVLA